jgi:hypothetical protein
MSSDGNNWADIPNANKVICQPKDLQHGLTYFRVVVSNGSESKTSATASIRVNNCFIPVNPNVRSRIGGM